MRTPAAQRREAFHHACRGASRVVTSFPNLGNRSVTSGGRGCAHASRHAWSAGHAALATFRPASLNLLMSERNFTLHLKRMICVGAAVMGVAASASVATASAATITEAGSSLVYPLVYQVEPRLHRRQDQRRRRWLERRHRRHHAPARVNIGASDAPMTTSQVQQRLAQPGRDPVGAERDRRRLQHPRRSRAA